MSTTQTRERPILFSGPMVQAIRRKDNPKTQTRRIVRFDRMRPGTRAFMRETMNAATSPEDKVMMASHIAASYKCQYGVPGDRLYVREATICIPTGPTLVGYVADGCRKTEAFERLRPAMLMPRGWSRITLEVMRVRVERVQDISEADAIAEGLPAQEGDGGTNRTGFLWKGIGYHGAGFTRHGDLTFHTPARDGSGRCGCIVGGPSPAQCAYRELWDSINGKGSWASNPWVWVVEFKRVEAAA